MRSPVQIVAFAALLSLMSASVAGGAEYRSPLPYATMYDQLKVGMDRGQVHEITRATQLEREPTDFEATNLLRLEFVNRHCQAQLLRLHWFKGRLHRVEHFQLDPGGVTYQERGDPDPIGEGLVRRLTEVANLYTSQWEKLLAAIALEGSPALQAKAKQATEELNQRLEALRQATQR
ncbi:MAG: hypothetical protein ACREJ6_13650 [Candidatus Methylomirabilis sp.]